jgi:hypothetical protein
MHFVDDIHFVFTSLGRDPHLVHQHTYVVNRIVRGGIKFLDIKGCELVERPAGFTFIARFRIILRILAVDGFGQYPCTGCLADAPGTGKKEGLGKVVVPDGTLKGLYYGGLPYHHPEGCGAIFPGRYNEIFHGSKVGFLTKTKRVYAQEIRDAASGSFFLRCRKPGVYCQIDHQALFVFA